MTEKELKHRRQITTLLKKKKKRAIKVTHDRTSMSALKGTSAAKEEFLFHQKNIHLSGLEGTVSYFMFSMIYGCLPSTQTIT